MDMVSLNTYGSILQNYQVPVIPTVGVEEVRKQDQERETASMTPISQVQNITPINRQNAQLEDISVTFNKQEDFGYLGQDSDIENLDVQKAISDMRKDEVLKQYQYFVGNTNIFGSEDGLVFAK